MTGFQEIRLTPIENGTVLDHLPVGTAQKIVEILRLNHSAGAVTIAINTESKKEGKKDLIFIENRELSPPEIEKIALVAHGATWNTIRNKSVVSKKKIDLPRRVEGILQCPNSKCMSRNEPVSSRFLISSPPLQATCFYCERAITKSDIQKAIQ